jgi:DNA-directed RNA polymerase
MFESYYQSSFNNLSYNDLYFNAFDSHVLEVVTHAKASSTLAVSFDGTNNGTQHLAALVHDPISGAQVNLVPSDKPADVYQEVADLVERNLSNLKDTYLDQCQRLPNDLL